jgi:glycosyltransferase involved in cell wall biosynthesis
MFRSVGEPNAGPLVTVGLSFYNEAQFLAGAIETVRQQTLGDWELVLVDDGSSDESSEIAETAAAADDRAYLLRHAGGVNAGLPASRNLALGAARGRFICFLDADDRWAVGKLERQVALMEQYQSAAMVCGPTWRMPLDVESYPPVTVVSPLAPRLLRRGQFPRLIVRGAVRTPVPSDVMYRTDALRQVGGVPPGPNMHEDQRTFVAVGLQGDVFVSDEALTRYTIRPDSVSGAITHGGDAMTIVRQHLAFERWIREYARRRGLRGLALVAVLDAHRFRRGVGRRIELVVRRLNTVGRAPA